MKLLIVSDRPDTADGLSAVLTAMGHEPHVTGVQQSETQTGLSTTVATFAPAAILLDAPSMTASALAAVSTLQGDFNSRWIPTVLLTGATRRDAQRWSDLQRRVDHRICALPFHGALNPLYRLVGLLYGLDPHEGEFKTN
jgi:CheY-like chemotaxis protein